MSILTRTKTFFNYFFIALVWKDRLPFQVSLLSTTPQDFVDLEIRGKSKVDEG